MPRNARPLPGDGWDTLEFSVAASASSSHSGLGVGKFDYSVTGGTRFADTAVTTATGIALAVASNSGASGAAATATFSLPSLGYSTSWSDTAWHGTLKIAARLRNVKPYITDGSQIKFKCDSIEIWLNDATLLQTHAAVDLNSAGLGPSYIPVIGEPFALSWYCDAVSESLPGSPGSTYDADAIASLSVGDCGVRWKETSGGAWQDGPVAILAPSAPSLATQPFSLSFGTVTAGRTYGTLGNAYSRVHLNRSLVRTDYAQYSITVRCIPPLADDGGGLPFITYGPYVDACEATDGTGPKKRDYYDGYETIDTRTGSVTLYPNWESLFKRFNNDYCALWYRDALPKTQSLGEHGWTPKDGDGGAITDDPGLDQATIATVHPSFTQFLERVTSASSVIEQPMGYALYAPASEHVSKSEIHKVEYVETGNCSAAPSWFIPPGCPPHYTSSLSRMVVWATPPTYTNGIEGKVWIFPYTVEDKYSNATLQTYQYHDDPLIRYWNFWGNRHWQYFFYYPVDDGTGIQTLWKVGGAGIAREYFTETRQQVIYHPSLPSEQRTKERTANAISPLDDSAHAPFLDTYCGQFRWIGASRWLTQAIALAFTQYTSASSSLWTLTSCTAVYGANIVLTPSGSSIVAEIDLGSFTGEGYQAAHLAGSFVLDWTLANITAMRVYLVGVDGTKTLLASSPGTYAKPAAVSSQYAGSWAIDNGGAWITDLGADHDAGGISAATMADPERCTAFQLGPDRTFAKLRFEITVTDPLSTVTIKYPGLVAPTLAPKIVQENGQCSTALWPSGPAIRIGNWQTYDADLGILNPPVVNGLGYKGTVVDALVSKRLLVLGVAETGGSPDLTTELAQIFDTFELQSVAASDLNSLYYILPGVAGDPKLYWALLNTVAEIPPLGMLPRRARDASWAETGAWCLHAWDHSFAVKGLVAPAEAPHLFTGSDAQVSVPITDPATGYKENAANLALNGDETGYKIKTSSLDMARVRPGPSGFFCVLKQQQTASGDCDLHQTKHGEHQQVDTPDGNLRASWSNSAANGFARRTNLTATHAYTGGWTAPRIVVDDNGQAIIHAYHTNQGGGDPLASGLYEFTSDDNGASWTSAASLGTGAHSMIRCAKGGGAMMNVVYVPDAGVSGVGTFKSRFKAVPDAAWSAFVTMKDQAAANLRTAGGMFGFDHAAEEADRWWLNFVPEGGTDSVTYWCADKGATWTLA